MFEKSDYWQTYWSKESTPHNQQDENGYKLWSTEYECLVNLASRRRIIEFACGDGEFYRRLKFGDDTYTGIDYSPAMVEEFKIRNPEAKAIIGDIRLYEQTESVDLIISSGLMQYLSVPDVKKSLRSCKSMLDKDGHILHLSIPWAAMRWRYYSGVGLGRPASLTTVGKGLVVGALERIGARPAIGTWHSMSSLRRVAESEGLRAAFYGSLTHPYRFHARFTHKQA
ncbi:MAG: class I SAM-dependent methyltransferase [Candidatus Nanopelagicales bacterium]